MTTPQPYSQPYYEPEGRAVVYKTPRTPAEQKAASSMVLGVMALVFCLVPVVGLVAWILAPAGIVVGRKAMRMGMPRPAGIVLGAVALGICVLWAAFAFVFFAAA